MTQNGTILNSTSTAYRARTGGPKLGTFTANGTGAQTVYTIAHGFGAVPTGRWISPQTPASRAAHTDTWNATNLIVTFTTAPPAGTGNVKFFWGVGGYGLPLSYPGDIT